MFDNVHKDTQCCFKQDYMRNQGTSERDPKRSDISETTREKQRVQAKDKVKGQLSTEQETDGSESPDERQRSLDISGRKRQRADWVGEQMTRLSSLPSRTRDLQPPTFVCVIQFSPQFKLTIAQVLMLVLLFRLARKHVHLKLKWILSDTLGLFGAFAEPLRPNGARRNVNFHAAFCSDTRVNFKVTDATRPILPVKKGADSGAMKNFKPCGGGRIVQDKESLQETATILDSTQGDNTVHENECSQAPYVQPAIENERLGRTFTQLGD